jgi:subtilase family serine protease
LRYRSIAAAAAFALLTPAVAVLGAPIALAATQPATAQLAGTTTPALAYSHRVAALPTAQRLSVAVTLKLRNTAQLGQFVAAASTPGTAAYGHYLTPAQFAASYAPTQAEVATVEAYLKGKGLSVTQVSGNRESIDVTGTTAKIQTAFGTTESTYLDPNTHRQFYANDHAAVLPTGIAGLVAGVSGLDDHTVRTPELVRKANSTPHSTPSGVSPSQIDTAYRINQTGENGSGETVALWEFDGYKSSDLTAYNSQYGLSGPAATTVSVDSANYDSNPGQGEGEVELDSEVVRAVAPQATQLVYEAPNSDQGEIDIANAIVSADKVSAISISWGSCEQDTTPSVMTAVNNTFEQAVAEGISIYSAAGDSGSRDCSESTSGSGVKAVDFPGSSVYDTSVGGTTLTMGSGGSYSSESAWSDGGGGVSTLYSRPSWQPGSGAYRTVPDVSSNADPNSGYAIYTGGSWEQIGGTSAAAPLWAGLTSLYNEKAAASGKSALGFANPAIYQLGAGSSYSTAMHDVTTGSNQDYKAGVGYDEATGWGTPVADSLITTLLGTGGTTGGGDTVTVTNPGSKSGTVGSAASLQIAASDSASGQTLTYSATGLPAGLSINSATGLISGTPTTAGASSVTVTVKDTTGATGSTTFSWTVTGSSSCTAAQLIGNPGFETGTAAPWTASSGVINDDTSDEPTHSGSWDAWLDGYGSAHTDTLSQAVTVPAGCNATFSFWLHVDTDKTTTKASDKLTVTANSTTLATYSNLNAADGYVQESFNLSSFAGQTVTLKFSGVETSGAQTSFVIDDTALNAS